MPLKSVYITYTNNLNQVECKVLVKVLNYIKNNSITIITNDLEEEITLYYDQNKYCAKLLDYTVCCKIN